MTHDNGAYVTLARATDPMLVSGANSPRPVIHRINFDGQRKTEKFGWVEPSSCGMTDTRKWDTSVVRFDHALSFAQPCKRCFPNAR